MEWLASTLHTTSEHGVSSITTAETHTSAASSRLNWRPRRFKWTRPFCRKTKSGFGACAITFQLAFTIHCYAHGNIGTHSIKCKEFQPEIRKSFLLEIFIALQTCGKVVPVHVMKACWETESQFHVCWTLTLEEMDGHLHLRGSASGIHWVEC